MTDVMIVSRILEEMSLKGVTPQELPPLALAFLGDAVYELILRTIMIEKGKTRVDKLHKATSSYANAKSQAKLLETILPLLTEEEADVVRRGRNTRTHSVAKNASIQDYHAATGLEALMAFLYLKGDLNRCMDLVLTGFQDPKSQI